jgi:nucleoside-diphosphate-sugar epimerase
VIVAITGADGALGQRVVPRLEQWRDEGGLALDVVTDDAIDDVDARCGDVVVLDLGSSDHDRRAERRESATEFATRSLAIADRTEARHVVFVSSALVYGANPNNPLPLTEEATLRPEVEFVFARQLASAEELLDQWRTSTPGATTCVLRPVLALAAGDGSRLASALVSGLGGRIAEADPPSQFLHLDDLASAVTLAVTERLDGVYNVAPDGWVAGERVRTLSGERPRLPLPERVSELIARLRWRFQRGPIPPGLLAYTRAPWIVSNGRLRATGWTPTVTNDQAYVESTEAPWWTTVSPKRRQELTLGGAVALGSLAALVVGALLLRHTRRRTSHTS